MTRGMSQAKVPAGGITSDDPRLARTKLGSRARRLLVVTITLTERLGRGASTPELRAAFAQAEQIPEELVPASFVAEVSSMVRRGVLVRTGGHGTKTLYALPDSGLEGVESEDGAIVVLDALRDAAQRLGRAVSTREVDQELRRRVRAGLAAFESDHPNAVRQRLMILARPRVRGAKAGQLVVRVPAPAKLGVQSAHWLPADHTAATEAAAGTPLVDTSARAAVRVAPRSRASAVRAAIQTSTLLLGRPVTRQEIRAMLEWGLLPDEAALLLGSDATAGTGAGADDADAAPPAAASDARPTSTPRGEGCRRHRDADVLGRALAFTAASDADAVAAGAEGRVRITTSALTCLGGAPPRYATGAVSPEALAAILFEDLAVGYRVRDEVAGIGALRRRAATLGSELLHQIAWTREAVLAERLHDALASVPTRWRPNIGKRDRLGLRALATGVEQVTVILQQATRQLRAQCESASLTAGQREGRMRELVERLVHVEAALAFVERSATPILSMRNVAVVGEAGLVPPSALKPFVEGGAKSRRATHKQVWLWLTAARRFPPPGRAGAPSAVASAGPQGAGVRPAQPRRLRDSAEAPLAFLDRMDATSAVLARLRAPRTRALSRTMTAVVGHVLRDDRLFRSWLADAGPAEAVARQGLVVALGAYGRTPAPPTLAVHAVDGPAWVLSTILQNPVRAHDELATLTPGLSVETTIDQAVVRARLGHALTALG